MDITDGTRVVISAGGSGIGRAIAEAFFHQGARVHICDVSPEHGAAATAAMPGIGFTLADVAAPEQVDTLFDEAEENLGGLDVLVNNAGIAGPTAPIEEVTPEQWQRVMAVNVNGQFHCVRRAVPLLKAAGGGSIVNMSSAAGRLAFPLRAPYATSKRAVLGLTETMAMELGPHGIRVNAILPGPVEGPRIDNVIRAKAEAKGVDFEQEWQVMVSGTSLRRMVTAADIANMVLFLCSDAGRNISGQSIGVCGNMEILR